MIKNGAYDGFETDRRIIEAIEILSNSDILDKTSKAYEWWRDGSDEDDIVKYLDDEYPSWRQLKYLNWGEGFLQNKSFKSDVII